MTSEPTTFTIRPSGPFSLRESAEFGFGQRAAAEFDGVLRLAFCVDGYRGHAGVELRQDADGVHGTLAAPVPDLAVVRDQVARVLSLDHDGLGFLEVGERDPVIGLLQRAAPGLRPPLFHSPYEAAAWSVLSARRPAGQMMRLRTELNRAHGATVTLAGQELTAFPTPEQLLRVREFPGLPEVKLRRLHGVAAAARDGLLDAARLAALDPAEAMAQVRRCEGIGPFYAALVVIRACGLTDVLVEHEPRVLAAAQRLYGLDAPPDQAAFTALAEPWRPYRTWTTVLLRAAAHRLPTPAVQPAGRSPTAAGAVVRFTTGSA
jgi:DNA-3-methyladenine glycosylase II